MATIPEPKTEFNPPVYMCKRAKSPLLPELDGKLDKPFWQDAEFTDSFRDIEGDARPKPRFETRAKMLWDDENLYIGAELYGDEIWAYQTERDSVIFRDNDFEVFIDPNSDTHEYYEFEMNALNTVWDLLLTKSYLNGGTPVNAFDIQGLRTAVHIEGELNNPDARNVKWSVEIIMPFSVLNQCAHRNTPAEGRYWRINFSRVQWKVDITDGKYVKRINPQTGQPLPEDNWVWGPMGIVNMHYPELWGFLFFTESGAEYKIPEDEKIKWQLRKLYFNEYKYFDKHGSFCGDTALMSDGLDVISPKIAVTDHCFEISCDNHDGTKTISLFADGLYREYPKGR